MRRRASPETLKEHYEKALVKAEIMAKKLREIQRLKSQEGVSYSEAMERVGLVLPHTSLRRKLARLSEAGVQPGFQGRLRSVRSAWAFAARIGWPIH